ncbi:MAG: T9SS type A sorting domain-containing protein [Ignavibacteria bacterium]|nr:T9SS type A sorting domain-containing protein [Ignavibacteria bacterium]
MSGTVVRTTDGGNNWILLNSGTDNSLTGVYFVDSNTGFITGYSGHIQKTINGGENWSILNSGVTDILRSVFFKNADTGFAVGYSGKILKTFNSGSNWEIISSATQNNLFSVFFPVSDTGYISGRDVILKSVDGGNSWLNQPVNITSNDLYSIHFIDNKNGLTIGQNGVILKTVTGGVGIVKLSGEIPDRFILYQNYPNPFNPVTKIEFDIIKNSDVKISVFDITGRHITDLVNQNLTAGTFAAEWNASDSPGGVYFYRIETNEFTFTRKMILLK